jgi:outer membrane protein assembly factor BamB
MRNVCIAALVVALAGALAVPVAARTWSGRSDIEIIAVDIKTGAVKWAYTSTKVDNAHFDLYPNVLAVYPHYDTSDRSNPIFLDPKTGAVLDTDKRDAAKHIKSSTGQMLRGAISLANGWRLDTFDSGNTKDLAFTDKTGKVVWTVKPGYYPEYVRAHKDFLYVGYGYLSDDAFLFGYRIGAAKPAWSIDFNKLLGKPAKKKDPARLGRVAFQIIDDTLYAQTGEHILAIAPATGKVLWRFDSAAALGVPFEPGIWGGALDIAIFTRDADTVIVSFEKRILALRAASGTLIWSLEPDTFPHTAFPVAHGGLVYLTSGPKRAKAVAAPKTAAR